MRQICAVTPSDFGAMASKFFLSICNGAILFGEHNILIRFLVFGHKEKKSVAWGNTLSSVRPQQVLDCANYCLKDLSFSKEFGLIKLTSLTFMTQKCVK